ncbi:UDP-glucosyltransferase 2-like [Sabethes cyaneus]|uniref:UDP-glucosyltransferase 2-like n=1 Tax=Sabethes cyaneus TaxID=53552 RepID=UPI00237EA686|nr:UDP-glucosyltransferase 2-like [Sabethes cyaneus]
MKYVWLLVFSTIVPFEWRATDAARILAIFPTPLKSHQIVFRAFVEELLRNGHQLTVMTPNPIETCNPNITQIDWSIAYKVIEQDSDVARATQEQWSSLRVAEQVLFVVQLFTETQLSHPAVQALIENRQSNHFDAVIVEYFQMTPFYAFAELFNAPLIGITSIDTVAMAHAAVGNVANVVAHPEVHLKFSVARNFYHRLVAFLNMLFVDFYLIPREFEKYDQLIEYHFGSNMTKSKQLMNRVDFLMVNTEPALGFIRPIVPQSIQLGCLHIKPPQPLGGELQQYLDNSRHGVIYFSLGSFIRTASLTKKNTELFVSVFKSLKYNVLWKCDSEIDLDGAPNVRLMSWLPQQDVLGKFYFCYN